MLSLKEIDEKVIASLKDNYITPTETGVYYKPERDGYYRAFTIIDPNNKKFYTLPFAFSGLDILKESNLDDRIQEFIKLCNEKVK